ncbi:medium-chain fatty acid-CoA ligase faa2 [Tieghemiomyces parasiticus]|uniref:Long-chain-fatty-acid--CoA ligase n=1 Tax=Tieghemiomyces parasiticus TaxID=78921 RepID=A0A9W8AGU1_9FUNG|nr:medium-chain fatty acid-CoA ligase faa2 [Tieghemiomyces parasiticus]
MSRAPAELFTAFRVPNSASEGYSGVCSFETDALANLLRSHIIRDRKMGVRDLLSVSRPECRTLYETFQYAARRQPDYPYLGHRPFDTETAKYADQYIWQTYGQVAERATRFGAGLVHLWENFTPAELGSGTTQVPVGIYAPNRPEWTLTELGCFSYRMYSVALYDTLGPQATEFIINHAEVAILVCSIDKVPQILKLAERLPRLKVIISMDALTAGTTALRPDLVVDSAAVLKGWAADKGVHLTDFLAVEQLGCAHPRPHQPPTPEEVATICYTSGTTGDPKGAIMAQRTFNSGAWGITERFRHENGGELDSGLDTIMFSYLPLAHCYERICEYMTIIMNGSVGFYSGSLDRLLEDMAVLKPSHFPSVSRLLNRIYDRLVASTVNAPGVTGALARRAVATKLERLHAGLGSLHPVWDRLIFNKVRALLGGRVRFIISGSAPLDGKVLSFLRIAFCCDVREGYGSTETSAITSITIMGEQETGHVGIPTPGVEVRLKDVPEMNYLATDQTGPRGEICIRGPICFSGYYKDPEKSREVIDVDGWVHSGDIGTLLPNGAIKIIDRKKNIFKLAQGEYIAPEKIENVCSQHSLVQQAFVHGDSLRSQLVGVVVPDPETFVIFAKRALGLRSHALLTLEEAARSPEINRALLNELLRHGKDHGLQGFEQVRAIYLDTEPFSIDNNLLTPTLKLKRQDARAKYGKVLAQLYFELDQQACPRAKL